MSIIGGNSFYNNILNGMNKQQEISIKNKFSQIKNNQASIMASSRELADEIQNGGNKYDMAAENVDLSAIWQRARDWGLDEQHKMLNRSRELAVRASDSFFPENARKIVDMELDSLKAETTRIGLTNSINGSNTLSRVERVETIEEVDEVVEETEKEVTEIKPMIDVLWVMDRSGSLGDDIAQLRKDAPRMFKILEEKGFNVRMAVESFEYNLDKTGTDDFRTNAEAFAKDVSEIVIGGGIERGLTSTEQAMVRFGDKFREGATKVTVMITDENSDDFSNMTPNTWVYKNDSLETGVKAEALRQKTADAIKKVGSEIYIVGTTENIDYSKATLVPNTWTYDIPDEALPMPDKDYTKIVDMVGKGAVLKLDSGGKWVDAVTDNFIASVEKDIKEGKFDKVVKKKITSEEIKVLDEWDINFQVGNTSSDKIVETFKTSTARTSGLDAADFSTVEKSRESFDALDKAADFLNDAHIQVGTLQNRFYSIANDIAIKAIHDAKPFKLFPDVIGTYLDSSIFSLVRNAI